MKKTRKSAGQKVGLTVAAGVLLLTLAGFLVYSCTYQWQKKQNIEDKNAQAQEYLREAERITQEIESLKVRIKKLDRVGTQMSMTVFAQCTDNLYSDVFAISKSYRSAGVFVVTDEETVGADGCITIEQYDEMLEGDWTAAVSAPSDKVDYESYISSIRAHFKSIGRDLPKAYYFPEGTFTKENLELAVADGFNTFFYRVEEPYAKKLDISMNGPDDPIYVPYMFMSVSNKIFEKYDSLMESGGNCAIATRYAVSKSSFGSNEQADPDYDSFIENVKDVYSTITAEYGYDRTVKEFRQETYDAVVELVRQKMQIQEQIDDLKRQREELNRKISEIYGSQL